MAVRHLMLSRLMTTKEQLVLSFVASATVLGALALYVRDSEPKISEQSEVSPALKMLDIQPIEERVESLPAIAPQLQPTPAVMAPQQQSALEASDEAPAMVAVSILGAVRDPGVYRLGGSARIQNLIEAAGGVDNGGDLSDINLAAHLIDGTTLTIPYGTRIRKSNGAFVIEGRRGVAARNPPEYTISGWRAAPKTGFATVERPGVRGVSVPAPAPSAALGAAQGRLDLNTASLEELDTLPGIGPKLAAAIVQYRTAYPFETVRDLMNVNGIGTKRLKAVEDFVTVR